MLVLSTENLLNLPEHDKELFNSTLPIIIQNLDVFVLRFYYYFFQTDVVNLFKQTKLKNQYKMFYTSIETIITHLECPELVENQLDRLVAKHREYGVMVEHVDYFITSFIQALKEILTKPETKDAITVWYKIIVKIMTYFEKALWDYK